MPLVQRSLSRQVTEESWPSYAYDHADPPKDPRSTTLGARATRSSAGTAADAAASPAARAGVTTMMLRNVPHQYTRSMLVKEIDGAGFAGAYDFLHMPLDRKRKSSRSYAFVNFISEGHAMAFTGAFEGRRMSFGE